MHLQTADAMQIPLYANNQSPPDPLRHHVITDLAKNMSTTYIIYIYINDSDGP